MMFRLHALYSKFNVTIRILKSIRNVWFRLLVGIIWLVCCLHTISLFILFVKIKLNYKKSLLFVSLKLKNYCLDKYLNFVRNHPKKYCFPITKKKTKKPHKWKISLHCVHSKQKEITFHLKKILIFRFIFSIIL